MNILDSIGTGIFVTAASQQSQLEDLANKALTKGIDLYLNENFEGAIKEFKRSIGLSPYSEYASDAANYMANTYLQLNETKKAIGAYKRSIDLNPYREDTHIELGNLYFSEKRFNEAEAEYSEAVGINPSANNYYSLGEAYIKTGKYDRAESLFKKVRNMAPGNPNGNYGLGLVYAKLERPDKAVNEFKEAIRLDDDLYYAYAEMGYAYVDMGDMEKAAEMRDFLYGNDPSLAIILSEYIYQVDPPKFRTGYSENFFFKKPMRTPVASLDSYLENANASKSFIMKFVFDKEMDRESVENRFNWKISRAAGGDPGEAYNFGLPIPSTEVKISTYPDYVYYDADSFTATVKFTIVQNASADATIDPSHIEFQFTGVDTFGLKMNPSADQYSGFSGVA